MTQGREGLRGIEATLAWRAPADPRGAARRRARALLLTRIEALFARAAPPQEGARFRELLAAMPPSSRRRLLDAPSIWGRILRDLDSDVTPLLEAAEAELLRLGRPVAGAGDAWTALGDQAFRGGLPAPGPGAPRLPQGAVIDAHSPHATGRIPNVIEAFEAYDPETLSGVIRRLQRAARALPALCAEADLLVRRFAKTVVLRRDPRAPERFLSESTEGEIGRVLLCNPHLDAVGPLDLIEALVHETVHSYLSAVELFDPFIPDRLGAAPIEIRSPWTGATLDAQRLTHASLVWFALGHLWRRAARSGHPLASNAADLHARQEAAARGLADLPALLPALAPALSGPAAALLIRISAMEAERTG